MTDEDFTYAEVTMEIGGFISRVRLCWQLITKGEVTFIVPEERFFQNGETPASVSERGKAADLTTAAGRRTARTGQSDASEYDND